MISPGGPTPTATGSAPAGGDPARRAGTGESGRGYDPGPAWARYLPAVVALVLAAWRITVPSFWRDEAATVAAVRRPLGDLIVMLGNVDAVHSAYYLTIWPLVHAFGASELVLRLPSAVAAAVTATVVAAVGRRLISPWAGLAAGLLYATLPVASRYGQEARPYAGVIALAALASYLLVRVLGAEQGRRRWLVGYGISVAALGIANIFGLLLLGAHAVTVALHVRRNPDRGLILGWLSAAAAGVACASPLLALGFAERGQIQWLTVNKSASGISTLLLLPGSIAVTAAMFLAIGVALVLAAAQASPGQPAGSQPAGGQHRGGAWPRAFAELCLPWLVLPPLALFVGTALHPSSPVYTPRYILMCMPALALLAGAAVVTFGRVGGPVALAVIVAAGIPAQVTARRPYGHYDDIRYLDRIVAAHARPGDLVLYPNPNADSFGAAYTSGLGRLPDAGIAGGGVATGTLAGTAARYGLIRSRLAAAARVWVVEINNCTTTPAVDSLSGTPLGGGQVLASLPLHFVRVWHERHSGDWLVLYAHGSGPQGFACPRR